MLKKKFTAPLIAIAVLGSAGVASAAVLFSESFNSYNVGDLDGQGGWSNQTGSATVVSTGLSYPDFPSFGGAASMIAGTNYEKLDGDVGDMFANQGTYYGAALIQIQVPGDGVFGEPSMKTYSLNFVDAGSEFIWAGVDNTAGSRMRQLYTGVNQTGGGERIGKGDPVSNDEVHLVAWRFVNDGGLDEVSLIIDPDLVQGEPDWDFAADVTNVTLDLTGPAGGGSAVIGNSGLIDELRVATTWDEVVGGGGSPPPPPTDFTWSVNAPGDWTTRGNWDSGVPGVDETQNANHTLTFGNVITANRTVFTDSNVTVRAITFDNSATYNISGLGSVTLVQGTATGSPADSSVTVDQGSHQFQAVVNLNDNTTANIASGSSLEFINRLNLNGNTLTKTGDGTLLINNSFNMGSGDIINNGGVIGGGGKISGSVDNARGTVAPGNSVGVLTIDGNLSNGASGTVAMEIEGTDGAGEDRGHDQIQVTGSSTLAGTLSIESGGSYTDPTMRAARDNFTLISSAGGSTGTFGTVDYDGTALSADFTGANGSTRSHQGNGLFRNINYDGNNVSLTNLFALEGDADGDIDIDITDFNILASNFDDTGSKAETNNWTTADFDADGDIDITDFNFLAANFADTGYGENTTGQVPEPTTWLLMLIGLAIYVSGSPRRKRF